MRILFLCWAFLFTSSLLWAAGPQWPITESSNTWLLPPMQYQMSLDLPYNTSDTNYNNAGDEVVLVNTAEFNNLNVRASLGYGLMEQLSLFAQIAFSRSQIETANLATITNAERSAFGDGLVGARYLLFKKVKKKQEAHERPKFQPDMHLIAELTAVLPLYSDNDSNDAPIGDSTLDLTAKLRFAVMPTPILSVGLTAGYTVRSEEYSSEIPASLRVDISPFSERELRFWLKSENYFSTESDTTLVRTNPAPGGSAYFKGINASSNWLRLGLAYRVNPSWEVAGDYHQTIAGKNSAIVSGFALGVTFRPIKEKKVNYDQRNNTLFDEAAQIDLSKYDLSTDVINVSRKNSYIKIAAGAKDGIRMRDKFDIYTSSKEYVEERKLIAHARVVALRKNSAFLKLDHRSRKAFIREGYSAYRVKR